MRKSKGNMYGFITHEWNPLGGECPNKCRYCYVNNQKNGFNNINEKYSGKLRLIEKEMKPLGNGKNIFVCSCNDLGSATQHIAHRIFQHIEGYTENNYLIQSKNPENIYFYIKTQRVDLDNKVFATTIESNRVSTAIERANALYGLQFEGCETLLTIEPIQKFDVSMFEEILLGLNPTVVAIGADSKGNNLDEPSCDDVIELIEHLAVKHTIYLKNNLKRIIGESYQFESFFNTNGFVDKNAVWSLKNYV